MRNLFFLPKMAGMTVRAPLSDFDDLRICIRVTWITTQELLLEEHK